MADGNFRPNLAGIREALSCPGIQEQLSAIAKGIAAQANEGAPERIKAQFPGGRQEGRMPYRSYVTKGHRYGVALGIVTTSGRLGALDQARNHVLERFNH